MCDRASKLARSVALLAGPVTFRNRQGRKLSSKKIDLNDDEIHRIMNKEFIPGLFGPCLEHCNSTIRLSRRTRRNNARFTSNNN